MKNIVSAALTALALLAGGTSAAQAQPVSSVEDHSYIYKGRGPLPLFENNNERFTGVYLGVLGSILMHEFGHALIHELQLPATGPEEDVADMFSALQLTQATMLPASSKNPAYRQAAIYGALQFYYLGLIDEHSGQDTPWQDEHNTGLKRFRNMFCLMYGGNPNVFQQLAAQVGMSEPDLEQCPEDYARQNRAWHTLLTQAGALVSTDQPSANTPGASIAVRVEPSQFKVGRYLERTQALQVLANMVNEIYTLPQPIQVVGRDCGISNAYYDPSDHSITMCNELVQDMAVIFSDIEMGTVGGRNAAARKKQ